jgi:hypothetical protein
MTLGKCTVGYHKHLRRPGCGKPAVALFDGVKTNYVCQEHLKQADQIYNEGFIEDLNKSSNEFDKVWTEKK